MRYPFLFIMTLVSCKLFAQTSTNSTGSGNFNNAATWTSPKDLTGTANILDGHTITIQDKTIVYANKITFSGAAKLALTNGTSKWMPSTVFNSTPNYESFVDPSNWIPSSVLVNDAFTVRYYQPWLDSYLSWCPPSSTKPLTDYLIYDLKTPKWIQGIVSQGRYEYAQWVTSAKIEVSVDNSNWVTVFSSTPMNADQSTKVINRFPKVMYARYVKVSPIDYYGYPSLRFGVVLRENLLYKSCKEILAANPGAASGVYTIDPDGPTTNIGATGAQPSTTCYCDMDTDGGGWTLVLNYLHKAGTYPVLGLKPISLPLLGSTILGNDESASLTTWGHTSAAYLNSFTFTELRFYGITSGHSRVIHFKTSHQPTINYFKSGSGSMTGIATVGNYTALSGHSAYIPGGASSFYSSQSDYAMTEFPFWIGAANHWGIRGGGSRWEVDDFPADGRNSTYHQIWIR